MRRIIALIICALILFSVPVGCVPSQPTASGQNRQWIELEKKCYIIDEENRLILGQTTFILKGWGATEVSPSEGAIIQGEALVDGYMNIEAFPFPWDKYPDVKIKQSKGQSLVYYTCDAIKNDPKDPDQMVAEVSYIAVFARENPEWNVISIYNGKNYLAVCADTEQEAWDNFDNFVKLYKQLLLGPGAQ